MKKLPGISRLTSTLKRQLDITMGDDTVILGANQTYKSAIAQSLELCLTGTVFVDGKEFMQTYTLLPLAVKRKEGLRIEAQSAAGTAGYQIRVSAEGKAAPLPYREAWTGDYSALTEEERLHIFPMRKVNEVLAFDTQKAKEAITRYFSGATPVREPKGLSSLQKRLWHEGELLAREHSLDHSPIAILEAVASWARVEKGQRTKRANAKHKAADALADKAFTPGVETLPDLEKQLAYARTYEDRKRAETLRSEIVELEKATEEIRAAFVPWEKEQQAEKESLQTQVKLRQRELDDAREAIAEIEQRFIRAEAIFTVLEEKAAKDPHSCFFGCKDADLRRALPAWRQRLEERKTQLEAVSTTDKLLMQVGEANNALDLVIDELKSRKATTLQQIETLNVRRVEKKALLKDLEHRISTDPTVKAPKLSASELEEWIAILKEARAAAIAYEEGKQEASGIADEAAALDTLDELTHKELGRLLAETKESAEEQVNRFMPVEYRAMLVLENDGCEWLVVGADGEPHSRISQSGFQRTALKLALASVFASRTRLAILKLDDENLVGVDGENFIWLLGRLSEMRQSGLVSQVIVVSNREDLIAQIPANYHIIHCKKQGLEATLALGNGKVEEIATA